MVPCLSVEVPSILCASTPSMDVDETNDIVYLANGDVYAVVDDGYRLLASDVGDMVAAAEALQGRCGRLGR
jgi:hypothetical protein